MMGIRMSPTSAVTTLPVAAPMITPTASASAFDFVRNALNSAHMLRSLLPGCHRLARRAGRPRLQPAPLSRPAEVYQRVVDGVQPRGGSPASRPRPVEASHEREHRVHDLSRSVGLQVARLRPPGFIAAEGVLLRRGEVAVVAVGEGDGEDWPDRAAALQLQAGL